MAKVHNCYFISIVLKIVEKKVREYPTLIPNNLANSKLIFNEIESPTVHLNEVTKNIGDQDHMQSLVESFIGQAARWWGTHQNRLQSWTTTLTYFVERFGGQKLTAQAQITKFYLGDDLTNTPTSIKKSENTWDTMMSGHGHICFQQCSMTYPISGIK